MTLNAPGKGRAARQAVSAPPRVPLYEKVLDALRSEILAREYDNSGVLPSESELIERFAVSRITVRRALDELARAGLVERRRGRITRVIPAVPPAVIDLTQEIEGTLAISKDLQIRVLSFDWIRPTSELAEIMNVRRADKVLWVTRLRSRGVQPIVHTSVHLPHDVGRLVDAASLEQYQLIELLQSRGKAVASANQVLSAAPCPAELAPLLGLQTGEPVFLMRRIGFDSKREVLFVLQSTFRWDRIGYRMSLRQDALSDAPQESLPDEGTAGASTPEHLALTGGSWRKL